MKKFLSIILTGLLAASCVDTALLPDDKTVDEDFWKTKADVALMVNGAYAQMLSSNLISRLIVWGDFRSDELVMSSGVTSGGVYEALLEIATANTQTVNMYTDWQSLYSVINNCNIVIKKAESVMEPDPSYTKGDYLNDVAQMKTLRSLCYFYLVRNFRDVPYITEAYMQNSQNMNVPQSAPDIILDGCIKDLEEAAPNILDPNAYNNWKAKGYLNRDAVYTLLADIYLWKASVHHSAADYQKCVDYCNLVIDSKNNSHIYGPMEIKDESNLYPALYKYSSDYENIFITQNSEESIFELQFDGANNSNTALCQMYYKTTGNSSNYGYMKASEIFGIGGTANTVFPKTGDGRKIKFIFAANTNLDQYDIRKMIVTTNTLNQYGAPTGSGQNRQSDRAFAQFDQNYIIYRLSDVMLMKAEALVQLAADDEDAHIREAYDIVKTINTRALASGFESDSLRFATTASIQGTSINSKLGMEELILEERLRELCFEGKRWYDLLRYNYRHVDGVDYSTILAEQKEFVSNYNNMLTLMARKSSTPQGLISKMPTEPYLYMPIRQNETVVNPALKQNPVYSSSDVWEKNY